MRIARVLFFGEIKQKLRKNLQMRKVKAFCRFLVLRAPSVTLSRDTFLPERLIVTNCTAAKGKRQSLFFLRHKGKIRHKCRLPPRGSWRGAAEGECETNVFFKLKAIAENPKRKIKQNLQMRKVKAFCRFLVPLAPSVTPTRDTFLPERLIVTNCTAAEGKCADFRF